MIRYLMLLLALITAPLAAASHVTPKPNARIGSVEKPYASSGSYRWLDDNKGDPSGTVIDHATVSANQRGVNLERESANITIRDSVIAGQKPQANTIFPAGIYAEHGRNLLIERTTIRDWTTIANGKYRQGDCIDAEWGFVGLTLRDVVLSGCTDGGYDSKARNDLLDRVTAIGNKKSFRLWYSMHTATSIESINPTEVHIETSTRADGAYGMGAGSLTAERVTFWSTGKQPLFSLGPNAVINIKKECFIAVPPGTPFIKYHDGGRASNVKLNLGKNCAMDAKGYAVNTPVTVAAPRGFDAGQVLDDRDGDGLVKLGAAWAKKLKVPTGTTVRSTGGTWYEIAK
ncbi:MULTISPECIES: hypothetical protein [unclassified Sphingomonas]|uniref:hypothetical protein n=1 Tax=Sphingomonas sp. PvP015 TaxID=3156388 RepID=UPI003391CE46